MVVYFHRNPITYDIFYVGIASENGRVVRPYKKDNRSQYWVHYVNKHGGFVVQIVHKGLSKEIASYWERWYISLWGKKINGGSLVNLADGGETNYGCKKSKEQILVISERAKKYGNSHMMTKEARDKAKKSISKALKGKLVGKLNPNYGNRWTDEMKKKQSEKKKEYYTKHPKQKKVKQKIDPIIARQNMTSGMIESWGKKVINNQTGEIFKTIVSAAKSIGMKSDTLRAKLNGRNPNNTNFTILRHD